MATTVSPMSKGMSLHETSDRVSDGDDDDDASDDVSMKVHR